MSTDRLGKIEAGGTIYVRNDLQPIIFHRSPSVYLDRPECLLLNQFYGPSNLLDNFAENLLTALL